jgi:putative ABC transport system substrate-binding protein
MRRRACITLLAGAALICPHSVAAQTDRVRRIGILFGLAEGDPYAQSNLSALRSGLQDRSWTEGRNVVLEVRYAAGRLDRVPGLATELLRAKVDIIVTSGTELVLAAQKASSTIPVVMAGIGAR